MSSAGVWRWRMAVAMPTQQLLDDLEPLKRLEVLPFEWEWLALQDLYLRDVHNDLVGGTELGNTRMLLAQLNTLRSIVCVFDKSLVLRRPALFSLMLERYVCWRAWRVDGHCTAACRRRGFAIPPIVGVSVVA